MNEINVFYSSSNNDNYILTHENYSKPTHTHIHGKHCIQNIVSVIDVAHTHINVSKMNKLNILLYIIIFSHIATGKIVEHPRSVKSTFIVRNDLYE